MRPAPQPTVARAVLYLRQSTYREESISLQLQEEAGRAHCHKHGYTVVQVLADPGISGRTWKRPAVQQAMSMLEAGQAEVIVLWRWSRLSRSRRDWALAADRADLAGGRIESATEPNDATAAGRFARGVMTELAAFESERIGEQWKETHARRRKLGLPAEGGPRYGYTKVDGHYQPDEHADTLAEMYRRHLDGEGFTRIARTLNTAGERTTRGNLWQRITVTQILDSGFGAGKIIQRPTPGSRPSQCVYHQGEHSAVITADEWAAYLAQRASAPDPPKVIEPRHMLSGLIRCGDCGAPMHVGNQRLVDYKCSGKATGKTAHGMTITRVLVERVVTEWVFALAGDIDRLAAAQAETVKMKVRRIDTAQTIDNRIRRLEQRLAFVTVQWADGEMLKQAYDITAATIGAELDSLRARRQTAQRTAPRHTDVARVAVHLTKQWDALTVLEKRNTLRQLIHRIDIVKPSRPGTGVWRDRVKITPAWVTDD